MVEPSVTLTLPDADTTHELGVTLGRSLLSGTTLLLDGDLGSGKTTLIQGIASGLGITEPVVSPTFNLINEYFEGRVPLYHFDLYRLSPSEVIALTPELYWEGIEYPPGIVAIEWAERLPYHPDRYLQISLKHDVAGRQIALLFKGDFEPEFARLITLKL
ncbi:tRNA (adenosine(37)-N6)-threonylcarbamoyltransferase complex ATPase subunit type 1 TsaE [Oscillatoria sp. FACHB-1407]|uniref:tRNA (adenosine(37)-N6)-threonylcarbamoyltransferase complex ATPase subunit type 1 TsaE n=1 Tax=Oscillatoria sp. FACHB-1407 TaxID=2692847 RepID=UPI0016847AF0|nr:tRNA (adenosine(37)-N6)-threonylcarbamoyltransferase complex ATPase subunit type 1 TsaE [Oscillatoria sp. FACHB-1407]MBD2464499.1 tRNA (adenosine(37)-N6)-threonylcarbamoyltransferase complex ATPase subunit type 1 TsaE [Oscillatoria sp. FACHB-1407]